MLLELRICLTSLEPRMGGPPFATIFCGPNHSHSLTIRFPLHELF